MDPEFNIYFKLLEMHGEYEEKLSYNFQRGNHSVRKEVESGKYARLK